MASSDIGRLKIIKAEVDRNKIECYFDCESEKMLDYAEFEAAKETVKSRFPNAKLYFKYKVNEKFEEYFKRKSQDAFEELLHYSQTKLSNIISGLVSSCTVRFSDGMLKVGCSGGVEKIFRDSKTAECVQNFIKIVFSENIQVIIIPEERTEEENKDGIFSDIVLTEEQIEKIKEGNKIKKASRGEKSFVGNDSAGNQPAYGEDNYKEKYAARRKFAKTAHKPLTPPEGEEPPKDEEGHVIFKGGGFNASYGEASDLESCSEQDREFAYYGKIFSFNIKSIKKEDKDINIVTVSVTNNHDSVSVQFYIDTSDIKYTEKMMSVGNYVKVRGKSVLNTYGVEKYYHVKPIDIVMMPAPPCRMDTAEVKRVELHLHTHMSQQDALTDPELLVKRAISWGVPAVAVTDHGNVQAFPEMMKAMRDINGKRKKAGKDPVDLKIIYGMEAYITNDSPEMAVSQEKRKHVSYHCILLVKNKVGLKNLYKLVSKSNLDYYYRHPNIPKFELDNFREGIIVGSACSEGELYRAITDGKSDEELLEIAKYYDYLEIQPLGNNKYLEKEGFGQTDIINMNLKVVELADKLGKMTVATCDTHFLDPEDELYRSVMQGGLGYDEFDRQPPLFYRTTDEMLSEFEYLGERKFEIVVENTRKIAEMVENIEPIPSGNYPPSIEGSDDELRNSCYEKAYRLYGNPLPKIVEDRLSQELEMIIGQGYSVMYIAARKLVLHSASNGYQVGSRGSVGSSLAAFMSDITEVNSLPAHYRCEKCKYSEFPEGNYDCGYELDDKICPVCGEKLLKQGFNIPFETFLGFKNKTKVPDIDLNFAPNDQPSAHKYTEVIFGKGYVYRAGTIATIAEKTAMGYVKHYLESSGISPQSVSPCERERYALGFTGVKRTTGQHPGGIMVIPKGMEIFDFSPIQHPAEKVNSDTVTTQFDYHYLHDNILKLDILGHDGPEIIKLLEDFTGLKCKEIPIDDKKMLSLFSSAEALNLNPDKKKIDIKFGTIGIPEFGTNFTMKMLSETMPTTISELVRISGLSHGTDVWNGNAQKLIADGTCTLTQAVCCRDDIMTYLISKGLPSGESFAIMESVRKGKGLTPEWETLMKEHDVPDWYIWSCKKIKYMFPKAHAVAYIMLSLRIAWFKVYRPLAYYAAFFTQKVGDFDAANMIHGASVAYSAMNRGGEQMEESEDDDEGDQEEEGGGEGGADKGEKSKLAVYKSVLEMYQRDIEFLPIDLYKSDAHKFVPEDNGIRPPFECIAGVGGAAAESIVEARKAGGPFISVDDLKIRAKIPKSVIENLAAEGCLKGLPESNMISLFETM